MNKKQKQVLAELQDWYKEVKNNIPPYCTTAEDVVIEWGSERMMNAMLRAGYGVSSINDVLYLTPRGCKLIDTITENFKMED